MTDHRPKNVDLFLAVHAGKNRAEAVTVGLNEDRKSAGDLDLDYLIHHSTCVLYQRRRSTGLGMPKAVSSSSLEMNSSVTSRVG